MIEDLNISIDCKKITEWLFERKKIPKDWPKKHKALQLKLSQMVEKDIEKYKEISEYLAENKESFNYFNLNATIESLLNKPEASEKNFFGGYSSPIIKEWIAMKEFFQKDNIHIVDIGRIISQNVTFEIPGLKKNILLLESQQKDHLNKVLDLKTAIKSSDRDFLTQCEKIGIKGQNLEKEVVELILSLPEIFQSFIQKIKKNETKEILKYYYDFVTYINSKQDKEKLTLYILEYLYNENDDTIDYYNHKKEKLPILKDLEELNEKRYEYYFNLVKSIEKNQQCEIAEPQIDWNIDMNSFPVESGNENINQNPNSNEIIWDFNIEAEPIIKTNEEKEPDSNFKIDLVDNSEFHILENNKKNEPNEEWEVIDVKNTSDQPVYSHETLLSHRETRNQIISNLYELLFFLKQRIFETKSFSTNSLLQAYDHTTTGSLFEITIEKLENYHNHIFELINLITNFKIRNLFIIKEQPKARERIVNSLKQFLVNNEKNKKHIELFEKKMEELQVLLDTSKIKMKKMIDETVDLKNFCEKLLKEVVKKEISIVGDINKLK